MRESVEKFVKKWFKNSNFDFVDDADIQGSVDEIMTDNMNTIAIYLIMNNVTVQTLIPIMAEWEKVNKCQI